MLLFLIATGGGVTNAEFHSTTARSRARRTPGWRKKKAHGILNDDATRPAPTHDDERAGDQKIATTALKTYDDGEGDVSFRLLYYVWVVSGLWV